MVTLAKDRWPVNVRLRKDDRDIGLNSPRPSDGKGLLQKPDSRCMQRSLVEIYLWPSQARRLYQINTIICEYKLINYCGQSSASHNSSKLHSLLRRPAARRYLRSITFHTLMASKKPFQLTPAQITLQEERKAKKLNQSTRNISDLALKPGKFLERPWISLNGSENKDQRLKIVTWNVGTRISCVVPCD